MAAVMGATVPGFATGLNHDVPDQALGVSFAAASARLR